jgi:hypothetical protein
MRCRIFACSLMALSLVALVAQAGTMNTSLVVSQMFDSSFNSLGAPVVSGGRVANGQAGSIYQVDILFTATNDAGDKGWANTLMNFGIANSSGGSDAALDLVTGYNANAATLDINGGAPGGVNPIYATNADGGANTADLQNVIASIANAQITTTATDTRNLLGTAGAPAGAGFPSLIGSFYVHWNGQGQADAQLTGQQYSFTTTANAFGPTVTVPGVAASVGFGAGATVPEPATLSLLGLAMIGGLGLVGRRKA